MFIYNKENKSVGKFNFIIYPDAVFIYNLYIYKQYRDNYYPLKLFYYLHNKYNKSIMLECKEHLLLYYMKLGFNIIETPEISENNTYLLELFNDSIK